MTNRKTYRIFEEDERELVYEDVLDDQGQIVAFKDYQSPAQAEGISEYDKNGEETERIAENKDGEKYVKEFFQGSELIERHHGIYKPNTFFEKVEVTNEANRLIATREQQFDASDKLLKFEEKDSKGNLLVSSEYQYQNGKMVFEKHEDYTNDQYFQVSYEYDANGNQVSQEIRTPSGKLLEYQKQIYDDNNRLINESGYSVGSFNAIYGTYVVGEKYMFEHEYAD